MKKIVIFLILALICVGSICAKDEYKDMDQAPAFKMAGSTVFDLKPFRKKIEDNIAFLNKTELKQNIDFDVYYINPNTGEWVKNKLYGSVIGYDDRDLVELDKGIKLKKVPFIAIVKAADDTNEYEFKLYPKSHDIYIEIYKK